MKPTFSQPSLSSDGTVRASRKPMERSIWLVLAVAALVVAAPTRSDADPQPTCKAMCQRLTDCKMPSYAQTCLDSCNKWGYEKSAEGRAQLLTLTRYSCQQIQSAFGNNTDAQQHQHTSPTSPARPPSRVGNKDDQAELDQVDKELNEADQEEREADQEQREAEEQLNRLRQAKATRGSGHGADAPARGPVAPAGGRRVAPSGPQQSVQSGGGYDDDRASGSAAGGYQGCSSVCGRISQCGLMAVDRCHKICEGAARYSGHHWRIEQSFSCAQIKQKLVTDQWTCTAEASHGSAVGNGPYNYGTTSLIGAGNTRDEAAREALKDCNAIQGSKSSLAWSAGQTVDAGMCHVTQCVPKGSPL